MAEFTHAAGANYRKGWHSLSPTRGARRRAIGQRGYQRADTVIISANSVIVNTAPCGDRVMRHHEMRLINVICID